MNAKTFLGQIKKYDTLIENKMQMIRRLREQTESVTAAVSGERVKASRSADKLGDAIAKILDLENAVRVEVERMTKTKEEVVSVIDSVGDADLINVLYKRYVHFEPWEKIADEMGYSLQTVFRLHGKALWKVQEAISPKVESK